MKTRTRIAYIASALIILVCLLGSSNLQVTSADSQMPIASQTSRSLSATTSATEVVVGLHHTCILTASGGVKCWGHNGYGELGDGTATDSLTPVDVSGLTSGVIQVAAANMQSCALTSSGGVKCWGYNYYGQLGDGTTSDRATPVDVVGLSSGVVAIAIADSHTCVLTSGGEVKCWGNNITGELGNGTTINSPTPVDVIGLTSVVAIAAGTQHNCAMTVSNGLKCWGYNGFGQLGDGTTIDSHTPIDVSGLTGSISAIAAAYEYTCVVTISNGVKCWGYNGFGQLGDGTTIDSHTPVDVSGLTNGIIALSATEIRSCALTSGGGVKCWGSAIIGDGTTNDRSTPVDVSGLTNGVTNVVSGGYHGCALISGGGIKCWGGNDYGELGDGTTTVRLTPVDVVGFEATYSVSGRVTDGGSNSAISGVTMSDGAGHTGTTDNSGNYTLSGLAAGAYTLTPSKSGYTFSPGSRTVTVPANATGQDYVGATGSVLGASSDGIFRFPLDHYNTPQPGSGLEFLANLGTDGNGNVRLHLGEDVYAAGGTPGDSTNGTPVYAAGNGTVVFLDNNDPCGANGSPGGYGHSVTIEHHLPPGDPYGDYVLTIYGHLQSNFQVALGPVQRGQLIGYVSASGADNGCWEPHLHFGVRKGSWASSHLIKGRGTSAEAASFVKPTDFINHHLTAIALTTSIYPWLLGPAVIIESPPGFNPSMTNQSANVSATSNGIGTITIAQYLTNPVGAAPTLNTTNYYDVHVSGIFSSLTLSYCGLSPGTVIYFWDGNVWHQASNQVFVDGCVQVTVNASTVPNLTQLTGTLFGAGPAQQVLPPPSPTPKASRQEDNYEPDNSPDLAHTITGKELHNFCGPKDEDWVKFTAKAGWTYHIKADPPANFPTEPHLELYVNGGVVAQNDHYFGNIAEIWWWNSGGDQTVYVRATELKGRGDCGSSTYTLSVEGTQGKP